MKIFAVALGLCLASGNLHAAAAKSERPLVSKAPAVASPLADASVPFIDQALHLADFPNMEPRADLRSKLNPARLEGAERRDPALMDSRRLSRRTHKWFCL